ncbi:MAG: 16S rRNA (guanine(966)-N(2))-methyltransferase RsmD [Legionella sp.]|nr:MAG: 16S rRNA (guanine(966)-N(2))-methyltransferase RsmD [Legionella sp.]
MEGLRPTPDRVRETLFNWLMHNIHDARCLDAFAGSGALGFEAFSRGAAQVVFLEESPVAHANLKKIITEFASPQLQLFKTDARDFLHQNPGPFDIVFLDPPFAQNYLPSCMSILAASSLLVTGGLVYLETPVHLELDETCWEEIKLKQAGQVIYGLFKKL